MQRLRSLLVGLGSLALGVLFLSIAGTSAQQAPQYPMDDKLASEPAPWTVPGKWGKRGNWGRWGEQDKRGMLNVITPEMIVQAASLVKTGKAYPLGEELHDDVARVVRPARFGVQVIQELDGYDRVAATTGKFDPQRYQGAASFTVMHNHTGWDGARRRGEREIHGRPRRVARRREIQKERSPSRRLLDHAGGSSEHGQVTERRDSKGRHPAGPDGLAQDVGRAGCLRASRCGAH